MSSLRLLTCPVSKGIAEKQKTGLSRVRSFALVQRTLQALFPTMRKANETPEETPSGPGHNAWYQMVLGETP